MHRIATCISLSFAFHCCISLLLLSGYHFWLTYDSLDFNKKLIYKSKNSCILCHLLFKKLTSVPPKGCHLKDEKKTDTSSLLESLTFWKKNWIENFLKRHWSDFMPLIFSSLSYILTEIYTQFTFKNDLNHFLDIVGVWKTYCIAFLFQNYHFIWNFFEKSELLHIAVIFYSSSNRHKAFCHGVLDELFLFLIQKIKLFIKVWSFLQMKGTHHDFLMRVFKNGTWWKSTRTV